MVVMELKEIVYILRLGLLSIILMTKPVQQKYFQLAKEKELVLLEEGYCEAVV